MYPVRVSGRADADLFRFLTRKWRDYVRGRGMAFIACAHFCRGIAAANMLPADVLLRISELMECPQWTKKT